jgi:hypothetical protein
MAARMTREQAESAIDQEIGNLRGFGKLYWRLMPRSWRQQARAQAIARLLGGEETL